MEEVPKILARRSMPRGPRGILPKSPIWLKVDGLGDGTRKELGQATNEKGRISLWCFLWGGEEVVAFEGR